MFLADLRNPKYNYKGMIHRRHHCPCSNTLHHTGSNRLRSRSTVLPSIRRANCNLKCAVVCLVIVLHAGGYEQRSGSAWHFGMTSCNATYGVVRRRNKKNAAVAWQQWLCFERGLCCLKNLDCDVLKQGTSICLGPSIDSGLPGHLYSTTSTAVRFCQLGAMMIVCRFLLVSRQRRFCVLSGNVALTPSAPDSPAVSSRSADARHQAAPLLASATRLRA